MAFNDNFITEPNFNTDLPDEDMLSELPRLLVLNLLTEKELEYIGKRKINFVSSRDVKIFIKFLETRPRNPETNEIIEDVHLLFITHLSYVGSTVKNILIAMSWKADGEVTQSNDLTEVLVDPRTKRDVTLVQAKRLPAACTVSGIGSDLGNVNTSLLRLYWINEYGKEVVLRESKTENELRTIYEQYIEESSDTVIVGLQQIFSHFDSIASIHDFLNSDVYSFMKHVVKFSKENGMYDYLIATMIKKISSEFSEEEKNEFITAETESLSGVLDILCSYNPGEINKPGNFVILSVVDYFQRLEPIEGEEFYEDLRKRYIEEYISLKQHFPGFNFNLIKDLRVRNGHAEDRIEKKHKVVINGSDTAGEYTLDELVNTIAEHCPYAEKLIKRSGIQDEIKVLISAILNDTGKFDQASKAVTRIKKRAVMLEDRSRGDSKITVFYTILSKNIEGGILIERDLALDELNISYISREDTISQTASTIHIVRDTKRQEENLKQTERAVKDLEIEEEMAWVELCIELLLSNSIEAQDDFENTKNEVMLFLQRYSAYTQIRKRIIEHITKLIAEHKVWILSATKDTHTFYRYSRFVAARIYDYLSDNTMASKGAYEAFTQDAKNLLRTEVLKMNKGGLHDFKLDESTANKEWSTRSYLRVHIIQALEQKTGERKFLTVLTQHNH